MATTPPTTATTKNRHISNRIRCHGLIAPIAEEHTEGRRFAGPPPGDTRDARVQAERDRRAAHRAATQWANDNTADLRRLAGQITALTDLDQTATAALDRLHQALGHSDGSALPALLAAIHHHLPEHPDLAHQIDTITTRTNQILQQRPPQTGGLSSASGGGISPTSAVSPTTR